MGQSTDADAVSYKIHVLILAVYELSQPSIMSIFLASHGMTMLLSLCSIRLFLGVPSVNASILLAVVTHSQIYIWIIREIFLMALICLIRLSRLS